ncbi:MAG: hypothetical protein AAGJ46_11995 [Planctomycetota bacterium]
MYTRRVNRLQLLHSLTPQHFAVREAVRDLEFTWGRPPTIKAVAQHVQLPAAEAGELIADLARVGYVQWCPVEGVASDGSGLPLMGEIG